MSNIKLTFIQQALQEYMRTVKQRMQAAARRAGVGVTNEAINSISYEALQRGEGGFADLSFKQYLRYVDMGVGRGHPLGGLKSMQVTLQSQNKTGRVQVKDRTRKPKKIYSSIAYGNLNWLENKLLYGYTEAAIIAIKTEMENPTIN